MIKNILITSFVIILFINQVYGEDKLTISVASSLYNVSKELTKEWEKINNKKIIIFLRLIISLDLSNSVNKVLVKV